MPDAGTFLAGQGTVTQPVPEPQLLMSFSDAGVSIPTWTDLTTRMRAYDSQRGRSSELSDMDAGTCTVVLDNRDRELDPTNAASSLYPNVRPMNRVWLRVHWAGAIHDVFTGWSESAPQTYPGMLDAVVTLKAVDEFKPLALDGPLPTTSPPRDSYADLIAFDNPLIHWRMNDTIDSKVQKPASGGPELHADDGSPNGGTSSTGAIIGENPGDSLALCLTLDDGTQYVTDDFSAGAGSEFAAGDLTLSPEYTIETWFQTTDATPASTKGVLRGLGTTGGAAQWSMRLNTNGTIDVTARSNSGPATVVAASSTVLADNTWYHVVGTITGGNLRIYINGTLEASTAFAGAIDNFDGTGGLLDIAVGSAAGGGPSFTYDEVALYPVGLSADRVLAHYEAGRERGFAREQPTHERILQVLDHSTSQAPRSIRAGTNNLTGDYMRGQGLLETIRDVVHAEALDAMFFVAADGTVTFLDADHRSASPWNTSQATFGDSGSELPYQDITLDYSDSFIANEWTTVGDDGVTILTATDATSIAAYRKRAQSLATLPITNGDVERQAILDAMLAKYKDPMVRITGVQPQMTHAAAATAALSAELGDKLRVKRRPPGGGSAIDQQLWVQQISVSGTPGDVYPTVRLGVSPV